MQLDIVLKKLNFDLLTTRVRGGGSAGKIFAPILLKFGIPMKKVNKCLLDTPAQ